MRELALHILDIAENSVNARAKNISISVEENTQEDKLSIIIQDDGVGMSAEMLQKITDPFVTTRTTRKVGLGIPLLKETAENCNGSLTIASEIGKGTRLEVVFQRSHIDRMPLGDLSGTFLTLMIGTSKVHWVFSYRVDDDIFYFDDQIIKEELRGIPFSEPEVLAFLRNTLEHGIKGIQRKDTF